jgi:hypothetical protein
MPVKIGLLLLLFPAQALAHGFVRRYDLPIPLGFFLAGAGATVALSFLLLAVFARQRPHGEYHASHHMIMSAPGRLLSNPWLTVPIRALAVALLVLIVVAGFFGDPSPLRNIAPTFVWILWWVGMMFINTLIGDLWALVNPWSAAFSGAEWILRRVNPLARLTLDRVYPKCLGVWPAVILFLAFAWLELISGEGQDPFKLAVLITGYSLLTWVGMLVYGRRTWLSHGEVFTVVFSTFARFAPMAFHVRNDMGNRQCPHGLDTNNGEMVGCADCFDTAAPAHRAIVLRPPGTGLLVTRPVPLSLLAMVLTLLATVSLDGFLSTPIWTHLYAYLKAQTALPLLWQPPWMPLGLVIDVPETLMLLLFPLLFAGVYLGFCRVTAAAGGKLTTFELARYFILTLLPIAIAYHLSHYLTYLVLEGQYMIPMVSDPFGFGWDLFGTATFKVDIGLIGARFHWYAAIIAIVLGHVISVYLAHATATRLFGNRRRVLLSQLPMLTLMVGYTMLSLWIISQSTVE